MCDLVSLVVLGFACRLQEKKHMFIHSVARARGEDTLQSGHSIANKYIYLYMDSVLRKLLAVREN